MATKTSSESGDRLRTLAREVLNNEEYFKLKQAVKNFTLTKSVETLCFQLLEVFDKPRKIDLIVEIRSILPKNQREEFTTCYHKILKEKYDAKKDIKNMNLKGDRKGRKRSGWLVETNENVCEQLAGINNKSSPSKKTKADYEIRKRSSANLRSQICKKTNRIEERPKTAQKTEIVEKNASCEGSITPGRQDLYRRKHLGTRNADELTITTGKSLQGAAMVHHPHHRLISMERPSLSIEFGFRLQKSVPQGNSITVGEVSKVSLAELHGLRKGDQIVQINEIHCNQLTQANIVKLIKRSAKLRMRVVAMNISPEHKGKVKETKKVGGESLPNGVKKVTIRPGSDGWLGCSIRGGTDYLCDIHVISVDDSSPADCAGLKTGDVILEVNCHSIRQMTHVQAVRQIVTASQPVMFTIKSKATTASDAEVVHHQQPSYQELPSVPATPLRADSRCHLSVHSRSTPPQSPKFTKHRLPSYPYKHCNVAPVCSPSSIHFDTLKLSQTPPPPYTKVLPSQHRLLAKGDTEISLQVVPAVDDSFDEFCSSSQNNNSDNSLAAVTSGNSPGNTRITSENNPDNSSTKSPVDIKEENFCFTNKQFGNPDEIARSHEDIFDTTHEVTSIVKSEAGEVVSKNSLLSQIRGFRKETLKQVSPSLKTFNTNLQTTCQVNKIIQSSEFCCESTNDQRTSTSSRKSSANELVNALTHAIEARAQAMNRSIDSNESDANEEDWDF